MICGVLAVGIVVGRSGGKEAALEVPSSTVVVVGAGARVALTICEFDTAWVLVSGSYVNAGV